MQYFVPFGVLVLRFSLCFLQTDLLHIQLVHMQHCIRYLENSSFLDIHLDMFLLINFCTLSILDKIFSSVITILTFTMPDLDNVNYLLHPTLKSLILLTVFIIHELIKNYKYLKNFFVYIFITKMLQKCYIFKKLFSFLHVFWFFELLFLLVLDLLQ